MQSRRDDGGRGDQKKGEAADQRQENKEDQKVDKPDDRGARDQEAWQKVARPQTK